MIENFDQINWKSVDSLSAAILEAVPQQDPFRFIDRIVEIDEDHIVGQYTYKNDESFYKGHFPGNPVTPGVIQIETMAQTGVVAYGIYLMMLEQKEKPELRNDSYLTMFVDVEAEFLKGVDPGTTVTIKAEKVFWRRRKLRSKVSLYLPDGELAATATMSGIGVKQS